MTKARPKADPRRASLTICAVIVAIFVAIVLMERLSGVEAVLVGPDSKPVALPATVTAGTSGGWQIRIPGSTHADFLAIDVHASGDLTLASPEDGAGAACRPDEAGGRICTTTMQVSTSLSTIGIERPEAGNGVLVSAVDVRVLRRVHLTQKGQGALIPIFVSVLCAAPLFWLLFHRRVLCEYLLIALACGCLFWLQPGFSATLLVFLTALFWTGRHMQALRIERSAASRLKSVLWAMLAVSVLFLFGWKYARDMLGAVFANPGGFSLLMPLGVSYFVIRVIDTTLRWYRGELPDTTLREFLAYVLFPATIPAGPIHTIDRFHAGRLERITRDDVAYGLARVLIGIGQKVVIVDFALATVLFGESRLFSEVLIDPAAAAGHRVLVMPFLLFLYSYIDFSAYSNIAIGLSRLLGYRMVENFNWPILASNMQEYWKRWHMSLSGWCMRNIYMPFAIKTRNSTLPLYITMLVVGLWHSLSLSWFAWAMHHATGLTVTAALRGTRGFRMLERLGPVLTIAGIAFSITFAAAGYCFAFVADFPTAVAMYRTFWIQLLP